MVSKSSTQRNEPAYAQIGLVKASGISCHRNIVSDSLNVTDGVILYRDRVVVPHWTRLWIGNNTSYPHWTTLSPNSRRRVSSPPSISNQATVIWVSMKPAIFSLHSRPRMVAAGGWWCPLDAMHVDKSYKRSSSKPSKAWKASTVLKTTPCCMVLVTRMMKL